MKKLFMLIACMFLLSGCTKSNIVNTNEETVAANPELSLQEDIEIYWPQVSDDAEAFLSDTDEFPFGREFQFYLEPTNKEIMLIWTLADDFPLEETPAYAEALIKGFNNVVREQDFSIAEADENSFGGLWDEYTLSFSLVPESTPDDEDSWFLSATVDAGSEFAFPAPEAAE